MEEEYRVAENSGTATITVGRDVSTGPVSVIFATRPISATPGADYQTTTGRLDFADGEAGPKTFQVAIIDDGEEEDEEALLLTLSNEAGTIVDVNELSIVSSEAPPDEGEPGAGEPIPREPSPPPTSDPGKKDPVLGQSPGGLRAGGPLLPGAARPAGSGVTQPTTQVESGPPVIILPASEPKGDDPAGVKDGPPGQRASAVEKPASSPGAASLAALGVFLAAVVALSSHLGKGAEPPE